MARITVEDCIDKFPSRFELVLIASQRAKKLHSGDSPTVERDNDKNTVIALREIADSTFTVEEMKENLIQEFQTITLSDEENENQELESLELDLIKAESIAENQSKSDNKDDAEESSSLSDNKDDAEESSSLSDNKDDAEETSSLSVNKEIEEEIHTLNHKQEIEEEMNELISSEDSEIEKQYDISDNIDQKDSSLLDENIEDTQTLE